MNTYRDTGSRRSRSRPPRSPIVRAVRTITLVVCILAVVALGLFAWDRWFRFDDAADVQGVWRNTEASTTLVLDGSRMLVDNQVIYDYEVDAASKIITYTFGDSKGASTYRFSADRNTLVLQDNAATDWLIAFHLKEDEVLAGGEVPEGYTRLERTNVQVSDAFEAFDKKSLSALEAVSEQGW